MDLFIFFVLMLIFTTLENWFREVERFNPGLLNGRAGAYWHLSQLAARKNLYNASFTWLGLVCML
jgi:hypothetical protein